VSARHKYLHQDRPPPREGTLYRELYDLLLAGEACYVGNFQIALRDFHGFELVLVGDGLYRAEGKLTAAGQLIRIWPKETVS
jgi:hypothetical protein